MNKAELIEALSGRLGDRKSATAALDAVLAEIQNTVVKGDKVSITGFGVFEKRVRAARTARNPRTGEAVKVKKTSVPAFRPGAGFKELVAAGKLPKVTKTVSAAAKPAPATKASTTKATATATKAAVTKAAPAKAAAVKAAPARTTAVKKVAPAKKAATTAPAQRTPARSTTTAAKKAPARTARAK